MKTLDYVEAIFLQLDAVLKVSVWHKRLLKVKHAENQAGCSSFCDRWQSSFTAQIRCFQIMSAEMLLQEAHDISGQLQVKLERLPYVERAFVHCDYNETEHVEHLNHFS